MTIRTSTQPRFIVDTESERSLTWPEGSRVFCIDTSKMYILRSGTFVNPVASGGGGGLTNFDGGAASSEYGNTVPIDGGGA